MDGGALGLLKFLAPQIPSLTTTAASHALGFAPNASKWDLRTTLTVSVLRNMMTGGGGASGGSGLSPLSKTQATTLKDPGVKGKLWVAKAVLAAPKDGEEGVREAVFKAIEEMKDEGEELRYTRPELQDLEVEWTGYRPDAGKEDPLPSISEEEKYAKMMSEPTRTSDTVILYFHGGAYYLCDPATHRALTSRLAKETGGVVCSTRYRLAPQAAFPSQLLDALQAYLTLLHPPPGSLHKPIPASKIVLGGDSAGGNLAFALLQLLLQLQRSSKGSAPRLRFHGQEVEVPLPAACSAHSGWFDLTRSLPSITHNAKFDYLPPAHHDADATSRFPAEAGIWPADPPRGDLFCDLSLLTHPLVSLHLAKSWEGAPPMWIETGEEMLTDEDMVLAKRAAGQGVRVQWEMYEAMPHCFAMLIPGMATGERCMKSWGRFCKDAVESPSGIETTGVWIEAKSGREEKVKVGIGAGGRGPPGFEEAKRLAEDAKVRRRKGYEGEGKGMPKPSL